MDSVGTSPSLLSAMRGWWRERTRHLNLARTSSLFAKELWEFARDSTPGRRRLRYGDMDYDWEHRVDTTSATVGWRDRLLGVFHSPYQPTEPALFREMMDGLGIDYARYTFLDLGSGKGRTLLMASEYPFQRIVGVELLPELHRIAAENIRKFMDAEKRNSGRGKNVLIESVCGDACEFTLPSEPLVLYLFNPLPEAGLQRVMKNLAASLVEHPREVVVLYHNPLLEHVVSGCNGLGKAGGTAQYAIYASEQARGAMAVSN